MSWRFPIDFEVVGITTDSMSFKHIDITKQVEIPVGNHVGAFGVPRRFDTHKGVDLYCPTGTSVFAVEDGVVVSVRWFTGVPVELPWWCDTMAISVEGESGIAVYGEIPPRHENPLKVGDKVQQGSLIGFVERVLKKDKGRPTSMLHFALHHHNVLSNGRWEIGKPQPIGLLDPTNKLIASVWKDSLTNKE